MPGCGGDCEFDWDCTCVCPCMYSCSFVGWCSGCCECVKDRTSDNESSGEHGRPSASGSGEDDRELCGEPGGVRFASGV